VCFCKTKHVQAMTPISSLGSTPVNPLLTRASLPRPAQLDEHVYDPVLDPAYQRVTAPQDVIVSATKKSANSADDEPFSFWDFLDVINPLQHIPGVNTIYRELTGDTIKTPVKLIGATVLGGPIGFAAAMADSIIAESTGKDMGEHAMALLKSDAPAPQPAPSAASQFVQTPTPARAASQYAAVQNAVPQPASAAEEFVPDPVLTQASNQPAAPSEAQAFVQTAQIAAQANVFPTFKRTGGLGSATAADKAASQEKAAAAQAAMAAGQARFMPLQRSGAERQVASVERREGASTSVSELKARSKFAPGPRNIGGAALSPSTLAAVTAAKTEAGESARLAAAQTKASPQDTYNYARQASSGQGPAEMPVWFDQAMLGAIDKYKAMQSAP
jgi:hypothetical protein